MNQNNQNERIIFLDIETTGTDEENDEILEVAAVVTDKDLFVQDGFEAVVWHPKHVVENVSPFIYEMHGPDRGDHTKPCLLEEVRASKLEASDIQKKLLTWLWKRGVEPNKGILAGNSIHFDRRFLQVNMPLLEAFFYHRMFDVSALKTAAQMWCPEFLPPGPKGHRAMADVLASIELARRFKPVFESLKTGGRPDIDHFISEIARDFGESLPTKTEVLTRRLRELVVLVLNSAQPKLGPSSSYGD